MFEHEKLDVYRLARELNREVARLAKTASAGCYDHINQLIRCAASITRNIAEGSGEWSAKEKAKFYRYAKRSAAECAACLDVLVDYEMLRERDIVTAKEKLAAILPMLVKLIQRFEGGAQERSQERKGPEHQPEPSPKLRARAQSP